MKKIALSIQGLTKHFVSGGIRQTVLGGINLEVRAGEAIAITGRSGSGKSTLLNLLGQMDVPDSGNILYAGASAANWTEEQRTACRRHRLGFVFQRFNLVPTLTVEENVSLPLALNGSDDPRNTAAMLGRLGIAQLAHRYPDQISGGEQQRAAIARAVVHRPSVVIADEPTGSLDRANGRNVVELLLDTARSSGAAVVMATHSDDMIGNADRVFELVEGQLKSRTDV